MGRLLFVALVVVACRAPIDPPVPLQGTYTLTAVNGAALPHPITAGTPPVQVAAGEITFRADSSFTDVTRQETVTSAGVATTVDIVNGTFRVRGPTVTLSTAATERGPAASYVLTWSADGALTRLLPAHTLLGVAYLERTYRYERVR